ncbi:MAG: hypothetical protein CME61_04475 [Halobacteriovoraceae bacterium]|nr:hypothetical protein [Halobacteriovoraceae bacterium]|tara:strand:- start:2 stop:310 length:309 start_codon:yes stop_codon:yes gene_type:complete
MKNKKVVYQNIESNEFAFGKLKDLVSMKEKGYRYIMPKEDFDFVQQTIQEAIKASPSGTLTEAEIAEISDKAKEELARRRTDGLKKVITALSEAIDEGEQED